MLRYKALKVAADEGLSCFSFLVPTLNEAPQTLHPCTYSPRTDAAAVKAKFVGEVTAAIIDHNLTTILNTDRTAVFFEYLPRKTFTTREKTLSGKERATALLLGDCHGNKYPPFLIFKSGVSRHSHIQQQNDAAHHGFGVRLWKEVSGLQSNYSFRIYSTPTAWWNSQTSPRLLEYHFAF
ncbi:hypothetical protein PHMEG_00026752, partial [Phytophthora megakarya]